MPLSWIFWLLAAISTSQMVLAEPASKIKEVVHTNANASVSAAIDINRANLNTLTHVKGIGKKRAKAIIQYRKKHGDFKSLDDLSKIKGFTKKQVQTLLSKNQGKISV